MLFAQLIVKYLTAEPTRLQLQIGYVHIANSVYILFSGLFVTTKLRVLLDISLQAVATNDGVRVLVVDLWLPVVAEPTPCAIYIHGGGWREGTQYRPPFQPRLYDEGIAVAAITYRYSGEACFPAALHDCKAAVRWLRAHAAEYNLDPERFVAWGISAGGHLASLLGVTNGQTKWEGDGSHLDQSSAVRAVCSWCGPMDLRRVAAETDIGAEPGRMMPKLTSQFLGGSVAQRLDVAAAASPICHVTKDSPPHLLVQGARDDMVMPYHATAMHEALQAAAVETELVMVAEADHTLGGPREVAATRRFLLRHLFE